MFWKEFNWKFILLECDPKTSHVFVKDEFDYTLEAQVLDKYITFRVNSFIFTQFVTFMRIPNFTFNNTSQSWDN